MCVRHSLIRVRGREDYGNNVVFHMVCCSVCCRVLQCAFLCTNVIRLIHVCQTQPDTELSDTEFLHVCQTQPDTELSDTELTIFLHVCQTQPDTELTEFLHVCQTQPDSELSDTELDTEMSDTELRVRGREDYGNNVVFRMVCCSVCCRVLQCALQV